MSQDDTSLQKGTATQDYTYMYMHEECFSFSKGHSKNFEFVLM